MNVSYDENLRAVGRFRAHVMPLINKCAPIRKRNSLAAIGEERAFLEKVCVSGDFSCWVWRASTNRLGYGQFGQRKAHRVSYSLFRGPIPDGMCVLHSCDVRSCVNPNHLFLGTQVDNIRDMVAKGRHRLPPGGLGEGAPNSKLKNEDVLLIRKLKNEGVPQIKIARRFGVSPMTVSRIVNRVLWKHI